MLRFICGCTASRPIARENLATMDSVNLDDEGFIQCKIHHQRRYGWRSVPYTATTAPFGGIGGLTPLEYEQYVLWGEILTLVMWDEDFSSTAPDKRDNRDPQHIGNWLRAERELCGGPMPPLSEICKDIKVGGRPLFNSHGELHLVAASALLDEDESSENGGSTAGHALLARNRENAA